MSEKVARLGVVREEGFLYYVKESGVWRVARAKPGQLRPRARLVARSPVKLDHDFIYFLDSEGDISRQARAVPAKPPRAKKARPAPKAKPKPTRRAKR